MNGNLADFVNGGSFFACCVITLFFVRFYRETGDRLFGFFALAFAVFAANRLALVIVPKDNEAITLIYLVRGAAFLIIIAAVIDKNRSGGTGEGNLERGHDR